MPSKTEKDNIYNSPLECRVILLEHGYERLEKKVDKLSDKMDARFESLIDKMDKESKRVDARFEQVFKEIGNVRVEMRDMIWKIPAVLSVIVTIIGGIAKGFHWI